MHTPRTPCGKLMFNYFIFKLISLTILSSRVQSTLSGNMHTPRTLHSNVMHIPRTPCGNLINLII